MTSGYPGLVLDEVQAQTWRECLSEQGMEVVEGDSPPACEAAAVAERLFWLREQNADILVLEYHKKASGVRGIVFLPKTDDEIRLVERALQLLKRHR